MTYPAPTKRDGVASRFQPNVLILIDLALAASVFIFYLWFQISHCSSTFCGSDSFSYDLLLHNGQWIHQISGILVFLPMAFLAIFVSTQLAIFLTSALLSSLFFLSLAYFSNIIFSNRTVSRLFALFAVLSFWWMRVAFEVYKNEMAFVILLTGLTWLCTRTPLFASRPSKVSLKVWRSYLPLAGWFILLILAHTSTTFFVLIGVLLFLVFRFWRQNFRLASLVCLALLMLALIAGSIVTHSSSYEQDQLSVYFNLTAPQTDQWIFLLSLPAALFGFYICKSQEKDLTLSLGALLLSGVILGFFPILPPDWQFRFFINSFWILMLFILNGALECIRVLNQRPHLARLLLYTLLLFYFFLFALSVSIIDYNEQSLLQPYYTPSQEATLSPLLTSLHATRLYVPSHYWSLDQRVLLTGFSDVESGFCPCNSTAPTGSWLLDINPLNSINASSKEYTRIETMWKNQTRCSGLQRTYGSFVVAPCQPQQA